MASLIPALGSTPPALDAGHELADLLHEYSHQRLIRREIDGHHLGLQAALSELTAWLNDSRPYEAMHESSWKSMAADVGDALAVRGQAVVEHTPAINVLIQKLKSPPMGDDPARQADCAIQIGLVQAELEDPNTLIAAFNDLFAVTLDLTSIVTYRRALLATFTDCLRASGHTVQNVLDSAAGVLRSNLFDVKIVRQRLGEKVDLTIQDLQADSGLTLADRADLCRRLLQTPEPLRHHVVWLCYQGARVRDHAVGIGNITFFDGSRLAKAIENGDELHRRIGHPDGSQSYETIELPEVSRPDEQPSYKMPFHWPTLEHWVAARVDLGWISPTDPVAMAIQQAESLVRFTAFQRAGTSWRLMNGYQHVTDDLPGALAPFRPAPNPFRVETDETDFALESLSHRLGIHLPVTDPQLQQLLDAAALLHRDYEDLDATSIRESVSVIDQVAGLQPAHWRKHLTQHFAVSWARRVIALTIVEGINAAAKAIVVPDNLYAWKDGDRFIVLDAAVSAVPGLLVTLPPHHSASRILKAVAARTSDAQSLREWLDELVRTYDRLSTRLLRCRNSLVHGGPLGEDTARTVQDFAWDQARRTTDLAFWAVLAGSTSPQAHAEHRHAGEQWLDSLDSLSCMADAFK